MNLAPCVSLLFHVDLVFVSVYMDRSKIERHDMLCVCVMLTCVQCTCKIGIPEEKFNISTKSSHTHTLSLLQHEHSRRNCTTCTIKDKNVMLVLKADFTLSFTNSKYMYDIVFICTWTISFSYSCCAFFTGYNSHRYG